MKHAAQVTAVALLGLGAAACTVTEGDPGGFGGGSTIVSGSGGGTADGPIGIFDLGSEAVDSSGDTAVEIEIPDGAESFALVVDGAGSELVIASKVTSPSDEVVFDFNADVNTNRTDATDGLYTLLVPTNPAVNVEGGTWTVNLMSGGAEFEARLTAVVKNQPATDNTIDLNLYFVGTEGLDAATAESDEDFQAIVSNVSSIYQGAGLSVRAISYQDISDSDADTYGVIDSDAELASLFQLAPRESAVAINMFFVGDISLGSSGFTTAGLAGGVPGPPVLQGTSRSGVAVNLSSFLAARAAGDAEMLTEASEQLEIIMAHESGHFLGLYHTVEKNGAAGDGNFVGEDPLSDTATCPASADTDGDGTFSAAECAGQGADNLMFWSPPNDGRSLSSQQAAVLTANPVVH